jgi:hypothetical protein
MHTYEAVLADLKVRFSGQILLSPADLAPLIMVSAQGQANLRHAGTFPMPVRKVGRRVGVSIYDVAHFLTSDSSAPQKPISPPSTATKPVANVTPGKRRRKGQHDWMLALRMSIDFQEALYANVIRMAADEHIEPAKESQGARKRPGL